MANLSRPNCESEGLRSNRAALQAVLDGAHTLVVLLDTQGLVVDASRVAFALIHSSIEQVVDVPFEDSQWCNHDADQMNRVRDAVNRASQGERVSLQHTQCTCGSDLRILDLVITPIRNEVGAIVWLVSEGNDVTDLRRLEFERSDMEQRLHHSARLGSVGRLATSVAHDFNNLLTVMGSGLEMLRAEGGDKRSHFDILDDMSEAVHSAAVLSRQLLTFSRKQVSDSEDFAVDESVKSVAKMWRHALSDTTTLTVELNAPDKCVRMSRGHYEQILVNLIVNAQDAMPGGGKMTLRTACTSFNCLPQHAFGQREAHGNYIITTLEDTGSGMSPETLHQVFDLFFTTKSEGTGVGLATVHRLVTQAGGFVTLESTQGEGTQVGICLPLVEADQMVTLAPESGERFSSTVLLVDEDATALEGELSMLEQLGFDVVAVPSSQAALLALSKRSDIKILMTEVFTVGMSGVQLAELATRVQPDMRVVFVSAYPARHEVTRWLQTGQASFIGKPLTKERLSELLHRESNHWGIAIA
jgi:signal transduction histidine kinase/ActR/RegA family two-component response regulator